MLEDKTERIRQAQLVSPAINGLCNFSETAWKEKLLEAGYVKNKKSLGSLLGISYYLEKSGACWS